MNTSRGVRMLLLLALPVLLGGCLLQFSPPEIHLMTEHAYSGSEILIPYELWGDGASAHARWTLELFDGSQWEFLQSREIRMPSGSSGILSLGELPELLYRVTFDLLTTRDGSYEVVPYLTMAREFYVDRSPPPDPIIEPEPSWNVDLVESATATAGDGSTRAWITLNYTGSPNLAFESHERLLVARGATPPVPGIHEYDGGEIELWPDSTESGFTAMVTVVVVDTAGNRSNTRLLTYTTL